MVATQLLNGWMYDSDNHFKGTARDIVIAWLEDVLSYAEDLDPRDVRPSPPPVAAAVAAEDLAPRMDLPPSRLEDVPSYAEDLDGGDVLPFVEQIHYLEGTWFDC